jgi:uncharacterized RDD family membrane protein YckC
MGPSPFADWSARVSAALLDGLIWLLAAVFVVAFGTIPGIHGLGSLGLMVLTGGVYYTATMVRRGAHNGQTLGKQATAIRVVRQDGKPVTVSTVLKRELLAKPVVGSVTLGVDYLWPLGQREKGALHDLLAKTRVVTVRPAPVAPPARLSPELGRYVYAAQMIEAGIVETVRSQRLPYQDVCTEVSSLVALIRDSAQRAQPLHTALAQRPVESIEARLAELEGADKPELVAALQTQLPAQRRMHEQLERYTDHLERVLVELDTVRAHLLSVAAADTGFERERLATRVRELRDEMGFVAEGFSEAYG